MSVLGVRTHGTNRKEIVATLTRQDLCDRCPAAGSAVVVLPLREGEDPTVPHPKILVMCTHHLNKHEPALAIVGATIYRKEL